MATTHAKVSTKPDPGDTSLIRPIDWNAVHVGNAFGFVSVKDPPYSAVGDGVTNDTPAFQAAADSGYTVLVPPGKYYLATPVTFVSGFHIIGEGSRRLMIDGDGTHEAVIYPLTCAFKPAAPLDVQNLVTIKGLAFQGGTTQVDLGMTHEAAVEDIEFRGFTTAGLCHVLGEKNRYSRLRFDFTANSTYGLGFGYEASINYSGGLYAGQVPATFFGSPDAWNDRTVMDSIVFQAGTTTTWTNAAWVARLLSGAHVAGVTWHGSSAGGEGKLLDVKVRMQTSTLDTFIIDNINNAAGTPTTGLDIAWCVNSTFSNISPGYAGNVNCSRMFNFVANGGVTIINSYATGNNTTTYGFYFSGDVGQRTTLVGCSGAIYSAGANNLVKGQLSLVGCYFTTSNIISGSDQRVDINNQGLAHLHMADVNGAVAATSLDSWTWSSGGGGTIVPWTLGPAGPRMNGYFDFDEIADPAAPTSNIGRLYMRDNGSGKTQLVVVFPTGAVQVIATQP